MRKTTQGEVDLGAFGRRGLIWVSIALAIAASPGAAMAGGRPLVIAHRGGALLLPENTLPAFDNSVRLGVDMIEFDVMMTKDDQLIITHDSSVNPAFCTPRAKSRVQPGPVRALTLAQLRQFDCGSKTRPSYAGQKPAPGAGMPTLDTVLARYKRARVRFFGEIKMPAAGEGDVDPVAFARAVEAKVRKFGLVDRFVLQSFDYRAIDAMHAINPRIRTCLLGVHRARTDFLTLARRHHASCVVLRRQDADPAQVRRLKSAGITVFSDVVDDEPGWRDYLGKEVDALFTNDPRRAIEFLKANGLRK
jgi:glycerophosphoryl diester phosphodiesterase